MRKNMVSQWGKSVGSQGIIRVQQAVLYTKVSLLGVRESSTTRGFPYVTRMFSQTLSPAFCYISYQLRVVFYSLSTPCNNNNFSIYLLNNLLVKEAV